MPKIDKKTEREKLLAEIKRLKKELKKKKKYGVVWDEQLEELAEMCKENLPVLKEVKNKEIINDKNKPVNLLVEGDNYHTLSVLNFTHEGKVDVIYIDPPYNTGKRHEWKYNDHWVEKDDPYRHSKWLSFMSKRLRLAKKLLKRSGIIFISIGEEEFSHLKMLCDEIFLEKNSVSTIIVKSNPRGKQQMKIAGTHEYLLVYAKNIDHLNLKDLKLSEKELKQYNKEDETGLYRELGLRKRGAAARRVDVPNLYYPIYVNPKTGEISLVKTNNFNKKALPILSNREDGRWRWSKKKFDKEKQRLYGRQVNGSRWDIFEKDYLLREGNQKSMKAKSIWDEKELNYENAKKEMKEIFKGECPFDYPKTIFLMKKIINLSMPDNGLLLDFFAGSGTTGHALLEASKETKSNMAFILCTNDENKICSEVCCPRIKEVSNKYASNLKYFRTGFIDAEPTDKNKIRLTQQATEMLCIREGTFVKVLDKKDFRVFKNSNHYTGIIFDQLAIVEFKKAIKNIKCRFSVYVFSLSDETFNEEFADIRQKVKLSPIPEAILRVYRRIFR